MPNTNITPPRVALVDDRGMITREWYRFLLSLFTLTGGGQSDTTLTDLQLTPRDAAGELALVAAQGQPTPEPTTPLDEAVRTLETAMQAMPPIADLLPVMQALQDLALEPTAAPSGPATVVPYVVANLPAAPPPYTQAFVTDANATTFASVVAGGGANIVPCYFDGTNWRIG